MKPAAVVAYWGAYAAATGAAPEDYAVVAFGDSPAMATKLAQLVLTGPKRATAGVLVGFQTEPMPMVGGHVVMLDGSGAPVVIWRTTQIRVGPLSSVDAAFAWDEGEGGRTRDWWLAAHHAYFARIAARDGFAMHDDIETVFERFRLVWPPEHADP